MTRKTFLQTLAFSAASVAALPAATAKSASPAKSKVKRGVSLYSYQEPFFNRSMTLEDCVAECSAIGAYGLELVAEEMIPGYPNPSDQWVSQWFGLMDKYQTKPVTYTQFQNTFLTKDHDLTLDEGLQLMEIDIKLAKRLGFKNLRLLIGTPLDVLEKSIPMAEKYDVSLNPEIHFPATLNGPLVNRWVEIIERNKTRHIGLNPDLGIFQKYPNLVMRERMIRDGVLNEAIASYIESAWQDHLPKQKAAVDIAKMGANPGASGYLGMVYAIKMDDPKLLLPLMPYIRHIHAKFWEMTDDYRERSIPYGEVIPVLMEGGYDGYLASEYEGQRFVQDTANSDDLEQVRRQHVMLRRLLGDV